MRIVTVITIIVWGLSCLSQNGLGAAQGIVTAMSVAASHSAKQAIIAADAIEGHCEIKVSGDLKNTVPCNGIEMVLIANGETAVSRVRTGSDGHFQFTALKAGVYRVSIRSEKFRFDHPQMDLKPGSAYLISLQMAE